VAWSRVQSASTAASVSAVGSVSTSYATNLTSGTTLLAACSVATQTGTSTEVGSVSDNNGHTFSLVGRKFTTPLVDVSLWLLNTPSGDAGSKPKITATLSSGTGNMALLIQEVSGLSGSVDGTLGTLAGSGTGTTGSPTYSSSASNEYLVSVYGDDGGPVTYTKPAALTADANSLNTQTYADLALAYGNSTGGTEAGSWSLTGSSAEWSVLLVAFDLTGGSTVSGSVSSLALAAPAGTVVASSTVSGSVSALTFAAPAGTVSTTANVHGTVASLTWAAPAGAVTVTPPGPVHSTYNGNFTRGYLQYTDLGTGLTLVAQPGGTYHLTPASGQTDLTSPPSDGWWSGTTMGGAMDAAMDEALDEIPAHFTAADARRLRQRQVTQRTWVKHSQRAPARSR